MSLSPVHQARLQAAQRRFRANTSGLSDRVLRLSLTAMVNKAPGLGEGQIDPYEQALAQQALEGLKLRDRVNAAANEHEVLSAIADDVHVLSNPAYQQQRRARLKELEEQAQADRARYEALASDTNEIAQRRAVGLYEEQERYGEHLAQIVATGEAKAAEAADNRTSDMLARALRARL